MLEGEIHGRYKVISTLGHGSFASVYLARDLEDRGALVAIKEISTEGFSDEEYRDLNTQFLQETAFLMQLSHPGLPQLMNFFAEGACYYLVMEWIAGKTLTQTAINIGECSQEQVLDWGIALSEILEYLHSRKPYPIILGDLKPSNVMVTYDGAIKLIDFGVARYLAPTRNPRTFALVSPGYSPPEKYSRFDCDLRGDIYSLGATLYWALTKANMEKFNFSIPPLRKLRPDANHWLESTLDKCLAFAPERRFSSIVQVREELVSCKSELAGRKERELTQTGNFFEELYRQKYGDDL